MEKEFTKEDLKAGMVVEYRNGEKGMVIKGDFKTVNYGTQFLMFLSENGFEVSSSYLDNLKIRDDKDNNFDIMKVYRTSIRGLRSTLAGVYDSNLIWERKDIKEMTVTEIEKELGYPIKVVKKC